MMSAVALRFWLPEQNRGTPSLRKQESLSLSIATLELPRSSVTFRAGTFAGARDGGALRAMATRCAQTPSAILAISSAFLPAYCAGFGAARFGGTAAVIA